MFREPEHQVLEKIKNGPFFKWLNKMGGNPTKCNQSLHYQYHQERGHTMEDCKTLWSHLEQSVGGGKLKQFLYQPNEQGGQVGSGSQRDTSSRPPLGTINVILATPGRTGSQPSRVMSITSTHQGLQPRAKDRLGGDPTSIKFL